MQYRTAELKDIPQIQVVRNAVMENRLSDPSRVTDQDVAEYITKRGRGWVGVHDDGVVGFSIADLAGNNLWALFVLPTFEQRGIGRQLHNLALDWYFSKTSASIWLSTAPGTRAEAFYRQMGWQYAGPYGEAEVRLELARPIA
jgi:GNAT superfamily N-acetyltransferase